jgi:cysteine sulfinate desulfinase/cysteine desulfurase-like protein
MDCNAGIPMTSSALSTFSSLISLPNPSNTLTRDGRRAMEKWDELTSSILSHFSCSTGWTLMVTSGASECIATIISGLARSSPGSTVIAVGDAHPVLKAVSSAYGLIVAESGPSASHLRSFLLKRGPRPLMERESGGKRRETETRGTAITEMAPSRQARRSPSHPSPQHRPPRSHPSLHPSCLFITHVASNTGTVIDVHDVSRAYVEERRGERGMIVVDGTQAVGKWKNSSMGCGLDVDALGCDVYLFSPHKIGGPRGLGLMLVRDEWLSDVLPLIPGTQQNGMRGGTLPLAMLGATETALIEAAVDLCQRIDATRRDMDEIAAAIMALSLPRVKLSDQMKLPSSADTPPEGTGRDEPVHSSGEWTGCTLLVDVPFCSKLLVMRMSEYGYDVGIGSACQTGEKGEEMDPAYEREYHVRISVLPGDTHDARAFADAFGKAFENAREDLVRRVEERLMGL